MLESSIRAPDSHEIRCGDRSRPNFFHVDATALLRSHLISERQNALHRFGVRDSRRVNVGDQIPSRVGVTGARPIGEVRRQTLGGCETGTLADQEHDDLWIELLANVVEHADSAMTDDKWLSDLPTTIRSRVEQHRQQRRHLRGNRRGRESVADDDLQLRTTRAALPKQVFRFRVQPAAEIRACEVFGLRRRLGGNLEQAELLDEVGTEIAHQIEFRMNGIDGGRVIPAEFQRGPCAIRHTRSAGPQSSGCVFSPAQSSVSSVRLRKLGSCCGDHGLRIVAVHDFVILVPAVAQFGRHTISQPSNLPARGLILRLPMVGDVTTAQPRAISVFARTS